MVNPFFPLCGYGIVTIIRLPGADSYLKKLKGTFSFTYSTMGKIHFKSLPERTADVISDMLYQKNYRIGAKLPNEIELAAMLEVSRNTVRQAIKILADRNILEVQRGAGTFVSSKLGMSDDPLGLSMVCDKNKLVRDLLDVRLLIEPRMASLAAENGTADEIRRLRENCERLEEACSRGENYYEIDMEFHTAIAGCSRNLVVHSLFPAICQTIILQENVTPDRLKEQTVRAHKRIYEAVAGRKGSEAYDAMTAHLIQNKERILRQQELEQETNQTNLSEKCRKRQK